MTASPDLSAIGSSPTQADPRGSPSAAGAGPLGAAPGGEVVWNRVAGPSRALPPPRPWRTRSPGRAIGQDLRLILPEMLVIAIAIAALWAGIAATLIAQRAGAVEEAYRVTTSLARAYDESTKRLIGEADQTLLSVRGFDQAMGKQFSLQAWARTQTSRDRLVPQVALIGPTGWLIGSTFNAHPKPIDLADRPHFIFQKKSTDDRLYISDPVIGRLTGKQTIQLTRKLLGPDGLFQGVAVVSIDCARLSSFYTALGGQDGVTLLLRDDGTLLARAPALAGAIGRDMAATASFRALAGARSGHLRARSELDHVVRYLSFRHVAGYPLIVAVGLDRGAVFAEYRIARARWGAAGAVISAVLLLIGALWMRQRLRSIVSRRALVATLQAVNQGIVMIDADGRVPVVNRRALELLGVSAGPEAAAGAPDRSGQASDRLAGPPELRAALPGLKLGQTVGVIGEWTRRNGQVIEIRRHGTDSGGVVETYTDVTAEREATRQIRHLAHHDGLTGLPNRLLLQETLSTMIAAARQERLILLLIDLDRFKEVNDTLGHPTGDRVLIAVAARLARHAVADTIVARMGGDEFVLLLHPLPEDPHGEGLARRIMASLSEPMRVGYHEVHIGASIGIAVETTAGGDADALLRNADIALYNAKSEGRGVIRHFDPAMIAAIEARSALEADLRAAIEEGAIEVAFEAQIDSETLIPIGFEALARWRHPGRGAVPPAVFIPIAEECGLIGALGAQVLRRACAEAVRWPAACRVAVNVSPAQLLDPALPDQVAAILAEAGLVPDRLELEITEGVLVSDEQRVLACLHELKQMGVRLALDDFGTGYSSLSYLLKLPVDRVKIDRSFVQRQPFDPAARAIVEAIIELALHLGLAMTAEGVETEQQLALLTQQGCSIVQGWLFCRPMRAETILPRFWAQLAGTEHAVPPGDSRAEANRTEVTRTEATRTRPVRVDSPQPSV